MKKYFVYISIALTFFLLGFYFAHHRFLTSGLASLNSSISVKSPAGDLGSIPKGTEVHVISATNGNVDLYLFFSMSENEYTEAVDGIDYENRKGALFLKSTK